MIYREITPADNAALASLVRHILKSHGLDIPGTAYFDPELDRLSDFYLADPEKRAYFVLLDERGAVAGGVGLAEFSPEPGCAELQKLYLAERFQGQGLGYTMLRLAEERARDLGYENIYLETHGNLSTALHLYEKTGYTRIPRPAAVVHTTMDHFYRKPLGGNTMTTVYLIRHSMKMRSPVKGDFAAYDRMQPLSGEGEERAKQLLEFRELRNADFAMASTMSRSLATIRYLLEADNVPFSIDDRLRELDFGKKPEGESMDAFMAGKWVHPELVPEGGESVLACRARMTEAILETVRAHSGKKLLIGSHGAAIGAFLGGLIDGVDDDFVRTINLPDVFRLTFDADRFLDCTRLEMPFPLPVRRPPEGMPKP